MEREASGSTIANVNSPVQSWLELLGLPEYGHLFKKYYTLENILHLTETDLRDLGVRNGAHRARMSSNLVMIRESNTRRIRPRFQEAGPLDKSANETSLSSSLASSYTSVSNTAHQGSVYQPFSGLVQSPNSGSPSVDRTSGNLTMQQWYHARISRVEAEGLVSQEGMFLIRDSFTQPGDYVLTACWKAMPLHFVVNKIAVPGQPKGMYRFEEESFETVTQLIQYYVRSRKPVTASSGAVISIPVLRNGPLPRQSDEMLSHSQVLPSVEDPQKDGMRHKRAGSQPLLTVDTSEQNDDVRRYDARHGSLPSIGKNVLSAIEITDANVQPTAVLSHQRSDSEPCLSPISRTFPPEVKEASVSVTKDRAKESGPPKPSRVPTVKKRAMEKPLIVKRNLSLYEDDGKDYSDYDQVKASPGCQSPDERSLRDVMAKPDSSSVGMFENLANSNGVLQNLDWLNALVSTGLRSLRSYFEDLHAYENSLLTVENRPLDPLAFAMMKSLILQKDAVLLARHLTVIDLELVKITGVHDFGFGVTSGLELITLPQGHFLRQDIIERHFSLKLFVSLTILHCANCAERVDLMHKWIQVAHELRSCLGNLFGFSAVMEGMMAKQVGRLENSWLLLEQQHGTSNFLFANRLRSFLQSLNDATSILPVQNITVPHILPLAVFLQEESTASFVCETPAKKLDLDSLFIHLDKARAVAEQCIVYRKTAQNFVAESALDQLLLDMLNPRTHLKFLWGSKGIRASQCDRFNKFEEILNVLSLKASQSS